MKPRCAQFDPYEDRTARDIRNRLSVAFVEALKTGDFAGLESAVERICHADTKKTYCAFASDRLRRYRQAFEAMQSDEVYDPIHRAVLLWNDGLFFEVHEIIESVWNDEQRWRKEALRGWIQAAGVYVHRRRGAEAAARKLAQRAAGHLAAHRADLAEIANVEALIEAMEDPNRPPPILQWVGGLVDSLIG